MDLGLKGKRALITGASKGIGLAVAEALAAEGCELDLVARGGDLLKQVGEELASAHGVQVRVHVHDLSISAEQQALVEACGPVDILVNNAGSNPAGEIDDIDEQTWREAWDLKVFGYVNLSRAYYGLMKERGEGVIVNVIGTGGEKPLADYILGAAGNIALMGLSRALGGRSPDFGVRVVAVNPGLTATDRARELLVQYSRKRFGTPDRGDEILAEMNLPFGRMAEPGEIADAVAFLASPRAAYISGTVVTIDGGRVNRG